MRFSERHGYQKVRDAIQVESIDTPLRNALWNCLELYVWKNIRSSTGMYGGTYLSYPGNEQLKLLFTRLWLHHFKRPIDTLSDDWGNLRPQLRAEFYRWQWHEVFDFVEFVANNFETQNFTKKFVEICNAYLESEMSGYRFIGSHIAPITDAQEINEIEQALNFGGGPVQIHLKRSLELLTSRDAPDYRNSIKESISAVESLVSTITGIEKSTLGQMIKRLEEKVGLHPALKSAFSNLYGYTSDDGGIRHALLEAETVRFEEAKFFLVVCTAFINFVNAKVLAP